MHGFLLTISLCLLAWCTTADAFAESGKIYKWKDKDGKIHFSDKPPRDESLKVEEQDMNSSRLTVTSMPRVEKTSKIPEAVCEQAIEHLKNTQPVYRGRLVEQLAKKQISNQEFSDGLAKLEAVAAQVSPETCQKANPKQKALINCIAQNQDATSCILLE